MRDAHDSQNNSVEEEHVKALKGGPRPGRRRRIAGLSWLLGVIAVAVVAAGCGSSSGSSGSSAGGGSATSGSSTASSGGSATSGSSTASSGGSAANKSPIVIGATTAGVQDDSLTFPQLADATVVYAKYIDAHGGIDGHPLKVDYCDNAGTAAGAVACANKAASEGAVAETGFSPGFATAILAALSAKQMAWVTPAPIVPQEFADTNSFPLSIGSSTFQAPIFAPLASKFQCKRTVALTEETTGFEAQDTNLAKLFKAYNLPALKSLNIPATTTDLTPYVSQLKGADCALLSLDPPETAEYATAAKELNIHPAHLFASQAMSEVAMGAAPSVYKGTIVEEYYQSYYSPEWATYRNAVTKYHGFDPTKYDYTDGGGQGGWITGATMATAFKQMMAKNIDITAPNVLKFLQSNKQVGSQGYGPTLDFTKDSGITGFQRLFNPNLAVLVEKNGHWENADGKFHNVLPLLQGKTISDPFFKPGTGL
jgi:ABC-type branched-subunit amino acid transport system substrate-binding protein